MTVSRHVDPDTGTEPLSVGQGVFVLVVSFLVKDLSVTIAALEVLLQCWGRPSAH